MRAVNVCFVACFMYVWFVHSFIACVLCFLLVLLFFPGFGLTGWLQAGLVCFFVRSLAVLPYCIDG